MNRSPVGGEQISPDRPPAWPRLAAIVLLVAVGGASAYAFTTSGDDVVRPVASAPDVPGALQSARLEGRRAHYHLTFADYAHWHLKLDAPALADAKVDRWLVYGDDDVQATVLVLPARAMVLDRAVELLLARYQKSFSSFTELERTPLTDRSDPGLLVRIQASRDGRMVEMFIGFFADATSVYEIALVTSPENFSRLGGELAAVIRSFEPPPPEPAKPSSL